MFSPRKLLSLALVAGVLSLAACNRGGGFSKTSSGIEYQIFKSTGAGKYESRSVNKDGDATYKDRIGKIIALHVEYRTAKDSILFNSRKQQMDFPVRIPLDTIRKAQRGGLEEAISLMQPGDSGVFRFNVDTIFAKSFRQPVPPFVSKAGKTMTMYVKVDKVQNEAEARADMARMQADMPAKMAAYAAKQDKKDDVTLQQYVKKNNLKVQKDTSGVYYAITTVGPGPKPQAGQIVSVLYKGSVLETGKVFDSSEKRNNEPIEFALGQRQVIPGWDAGLAQFPKGSKGFLLIPSSLAYGQRGAGADIPADAVLRFDIELVDIKKAAPQPAAGPQMDEAEIRRQIEAMQRQQGKQGQGQ